MLTLRALSRLFKRQLPNVPLRVLFAGPFALELAVVAGAIGYISFINGQKTVNDLAGQLHAETTNRVQQELNSYLNAPHLINQINVSGVELGELNLSDIDGLERHFWQQMQLFPSTSYIYVGTSQEVFVGAEQVPDRLPNIAYWTGSDRSGNFETYSSTPDGTRDDLLSVVPDYNLLTRPWYVNARQAGDAVWGDIYVWAAPYVNIALPAVRPFYDRSGQLQGVFAVDLSLQTISDFLQTIEIGQTGQVFILDESGSLVASSTAAPIVTETEDGLIRISASDSSSAMVQGATEHLQEKYGSLEAIAEQSAFDFRLDGETHLARVTPYQDRWGLDWLIVVAVPESDFMAGVDANTRATIQLSLLAIAIAIGIGLATAQWVLRPIEELSEASHAIAKGHLNRPVSAGGVKELQVLAQSFSRMATQLIHDARYDDLTRLPNRHSFLCQVESALGRIRTDESYQFAILFLDFDRFKVLNDSYGHIVGDTFLFQVGRILNSLISNKDMVARLGGDEFAILLEEIDSIDDAIAVAQSIKRQLRQPIDINDRKFFSTASIGVVMGNSSYYNELELLRDADLAMYAAKEGGKDCYKIFDGAMHDKTLRTLKLETDLRHALQRQEFELHYQPIVTLSDRTVSGFEALIRWHHPEDGLVSPVRFISVAEEAGLIIDIGEWVLREACQQLETWQKQGIVDRHTCIHINLSGKQIADPTFLDKVDAVLNETRLDGKCIHLEITESILMGRSVETLHVLHQLKRRGIRLSIDDFGTGYSSLSYLQQLPVDILKVPRCFVSQIANNPERYEITRAITSLAHTLKLDVIAEGIEQNSELEQVKSLGCEFGQGYLFDRPMTVEAVEAWMRLESTQTTTLET